jgi:hypothetical protein
MAVSGLGHAEMLVALAENGINYAPDVVMFSWHRGDFDDNVRADLYRLRAGKLERHADNYLPAVSIREQLSKFPVYLWASQYSQLYSALRERGAQIAKGALDSLRVTEAQEVAAPVITEAVRTEVQIDPALRLTSKILSAAADLSNSAGAEFFLYEIPDLVNRTTFRPVDPQLTELLEPEVNFVSPLEPLLEAAAPDTLIYFEKGARHWTPLGNRIAARVAFDALVQSGVLERYKNSQ